MDNTAIVLNNNAQSVWKDPEKIRSLFAPKLTEKEFQFFISLGVGLQANPFTREIWAVKYDEKAPASIFLGRDFYRKKAQEQDDYNGHISDAVYSNDDFKITNGEVSHSYSLKDRGQLLGAYCTVTRRNITKPFYVFVELKEYDKGFSLWKNMKATMVKKVAEAQALRMAYQGIFQGTYSEDEEPIVLEQNKEIPPTQQQQPEPKEKPVNGNNSKTITDAQTRLIMAKMKPIHDKDKCREMLKEFFGIEHLKDLPGDAVDMVLTWISDRIEEGL